MAGEAAKSLIVRPEYDRALHIQKLNETWLGCPYCDALWERPRLAENQSARCHRCHSQILSNRPRSSETTLAMMLASLILYIIAISFPFLKLERSGLSHEMSVIDATTVLWQDNLHVLSIIVALFVLILPITRILLLIHISYMVSRQKPTFIREAILFRISENIDRWTMTEIFIIGVMVSLVKIVEMAEIELLPGFWAMAIMMILLTMGALALCRDTIWTNIRTVDGSA